MGTLAGIEQRSRNQLAEIVRKAGPTITIKEVTSILAISPLQAAKMMARWAEQGWLARIRQGLYAPVPLEARTVEDVIGDPWIIAARVFEPCYIGGWSAAEHWELTEQIFKTVVVVTTRVISKRKLTIQVTDFWIKKVAGRRFFGTKTVWRGKAQIRIADPSKTVVDMLDDPAIGGGARMIEEVLKAYLASSSRDMERLLDYAKRMRNGAILKRLGYLLERSNVNDRALLERIRSQLTWGNAKLDPALPADQLITRWRVWVPASRARGSHD